MQTLSARPTVRRLDADQVFRDPIPTTIPRRPIRTRIGFAGVLCGLLETSRPP